MSKKTIAIIPAAGRGQRMMGLTENNPKAMLPYKGKPIIAHNLDKLIENNIEEVIIVVSYKKEKIIDYVLKFYKDKIKITFVEQVHLNGLAGAVHCATSTIREDANVIIILGDVIIQSDYFFTDLCKDGLFFTPKEDFRRWCLADFVDGKIVFYDKPKEKPNTDKALIGVYKFSSSDLLNRSLEQYLSTEDTLNNEYQISKAIELYNKEKLIIDLVEVHSGEYTDMGEVEDLIEARKNITRHFNNINKTNYGTIIKTSKDKTKMDNEYNWYKYLPEKMSMFTPHLFTRHDNGYEIEFLNSTPIQELFIYDLMDLKDWGKLFNKIHFFLNLSKDGMYVPDNKLEVAEEFYISKNIERINSLIDSELNKKYKLDKEEYITINNIAYKNPLYSENLQSIISSLYTVSNSFNNNHISYYHGDLFFGNMFYDITSESLKVIDPRGSFGSVGGVGDIRYDIAKLNHSIFGYYDFIVNELYTLDVTEDSINYSLYEGKQKNVQKIFEEKVLVGYDRDEIDFITGILFLTMIPLHSENENNQLVQFATAVKFLNKFI